MGAWITLRYHVLWGRDIRFCLLTLATKLRLVRWVYQKTCMTQAGRETNLDEAPPDHLACDRQYAFW